jgi:SAM-dependent methyltransferase
VPARAAARPATKAAPKAALRTASSSSKAAAEPRPAAPPKKAAHAARTAATAQALPKGHAGHPEPAAKTAADKAADKKAGLALKLAPGTDASKSAHVAPAAATPPAAASEASKEKGSRKPKPPAKTMQVPAPMTDFLVKRELPDVRRIASAALLSEQARGITPPSSPSKQKEPERTDEQPVDATLIASSLSTDVHPRIEDNYDYTVLDDLVASGHCPSPTRMVNTGCSGGEAAVYFAKRGYSVVGIDSDRTAVGLARERAWLAGVEIDFMVGDLFETPNLLPAESFGLAIDRGAFYRLTDDRDRQRYLSNVRRLLFQGGVFYLSAGFFPLPDGAEKPGREKKKAQPKILLVREGGVVVNEVRQAGFEVAHRVLRHTADSGDYGELLLTLRK